MIKIAITASIDKSNNKINTAYIEAFTNKELLPIIIPTIVDEIADFTIESKEKEYLEKAKEVAETFDALILTGGSDINPLIYQKENKDALSCNSKRDKSDLYLVEAFIKKNKPIMGICRGMQFLGLTFEIPNFKQDLNQIEELHNGENHELSSRQEFAHSIELQGKLLEYIEEKTQKKELNVNSFHHQGFAFIARKKDKETFTIDKEEEIKKINEKTNINILANTKRVIEAFEHKTLPIFAVQWHPEEYGNKSIIINYFIDNYLKD